MAGLDPAIHASLHNPEKTWMRGSSPRMTNVRFRENQKDWITP
jgi:hypothetical protein